MEEMVHICRVFETLLEAPSSVVTIPRSCAGHTKYSEPVALG